ncbi:MAG: hypothetical protein AVDCRST_MAG19-4130, partial [uncultured Thermomicrobiales bacterium]
CRRTRPRAAERRGDDHRVFGVFGDDGNPIATTAFSRSWRGTRAIGPAMVATVRRERAPRVQAAAFARLVACPLTGEASPALAGESGQTDGWALSAAPSMARDACSATSPPAPTSPAVPPVPSSTPRSGSPAQMLEVGVAMSIGGSTGSGRGSRHPSTSSSASSRPAGRARRHRPPGPPASPAQQVPPRRSGGY